MAAVVWLGGPSRRWGSARWVSALRDLQDFCFLGWDSRNYPEVPGSGGVWPGDWTRGQEAELLELCVDTAQIRGSGSGAPPTLLGSILSGSSSSVSCLIEPFAVYPTPIPRKAGFPRLSPDYSGSN